MTETSKEPSSKELAEKMNEIAKKYGGLETNIPLTSEYWDLKSQARVALQRERDTPPKHESKPVEHKPEHKS